MHISEVKSSLLSLLSFKYFLSQRKQRRENKTTKQNTKQNTLTFFVLSGTAFSTSFLIFSSVNWRKTLHFEVCSPDGGYWLWAGIIGCYYTTKLLGGLIQKIHQSDRATAGLIFSKCQTGSVRIRPEIELFKMSDAEEIEVCKLSPRNTKQFLSRRRRPPLWAWFGHVKQSGKTRGSCWTWKRRSHYEQQPSFKILSKNINPI